MLLGNRGVFMVISISRPRCRQSAQLTPESLPAQYPLLDDAAVADLVAKLLDDKDLYGATYSPSK
jgi:hypothetical protein